MLQLAEDCCEKMKRYNLSMASLQSCLLNCVLDDVVNPVDVRKRIGELAKEQSGNAKNDSYF